MAKTVKAFIVHESASGRIISVGRPSPGISAIPMSKDGQSVIEAEVDENGISDLVNGKYIVDVEQKKIVAR